MSASVVRLAGAPPSEPARLRTAAFLLGWLLVAVHLAQAAGVLSMPAAISGTFSAADHLAALALSCALILWRVVSVPEGRPVWLLLGIATLLWTLGFIAYRALVAGQSPVPYPSVSDFLWLSFYPLVYAGLALLMRERVRRLPVSFWFQGLIALLGLAAICAAFLLERIAATTGGGRDTLIVTLAYPLGDVVALGLILAIFAVTNGRAGRPMALILVAFAIQLAANLLYLWQTATGGYATDELLDTAWPITTLLIAHAAWQPGSYDRVGELGPGQLAIPASFSVVSLALLIVGNFTALSPWATGLASLTLLVTFAAGAATMLESGRLRLMARSDSLTGLHNHGAFYAALERELADAVRHGQLVSVAFFDLDGFKQLNDTRGHAEGDRVLRETAAAIREACRPMDCPARLGGDEFAILLPDCSGDTARAIAQRVQASVQRLADEASVSFGVAEWPRDGASIDSLMARADQRLYAHKHRRSARTAFPRDADPALRLEAEG